MGIVLKDLRYALRILANRPVYTGAAILSLALGIGANTTIFTMINAAYLRPLVLADTHRLVAVFTEDVENPGFLPVSAPNYLDLRDHNETLSGLALVSAHRTFTLAVDHEPSQVFGEFVSDNYFDVLGIRAALGRTFGPLRAEPAADDPVVVLSHSFWQRQFASDPDLVGRVITLNGRQLTVLGVMPEGFHGAQTVFDLDLWVPWTLHRQMLPAADPDTFHRRALFWRAVGRLKPAVTVTAAQADLKTIAGRLERDYPDNHGRSVRVLPLVEALRDPDPADRARTRRIVGMLTAIVGLVLLIACANVANLLLASANARAREVAIRLAVGARRRHLVRQFLIESLVLALQGGALGLFLAYWSRDLLVASQPPTPAPVLNDLPLDGRVLVFCLAVTLLSALVFGLAPVFKALRVHLVAELKDLRAVGGNPRRWTMAGNVLVIGQVALSLIALIGMGLFVRTLRAVQKIDPGIDVDKLAVVMLELGTVGYDERRIEAVYQQVLDRAANLPGVESAALAQTIPLINTGAMFRTVFLPGQEPDSDGAGRLAVCNAVTPGYFKTIGVPLLRGRAFGRPDGAGARQVVIVNEAMAKAFWPGQDAVGQDFRFHGDTADRHVIGVVRDSKYFRLLEEEVPYAYYPFSQNPTPDRNLFVRAAEDPRAVLGDVREALRDLDRNLPLLYPRTMSDVVHLSLYEARMIAMLLGVFGLAAVTLAVVGIFGVVSYSVSWRHREIGIRMAMGARRADMLRLVLGQGMGLVGIGLVLGLAVAWAATRLMTSFLYGVGPTDPLTFVLTPLVLAAVAWMAIFYPARRAIAVNPMAALRYE